MLGSQDRLDLLDLQEIRCIHNFLHHYIGLIIKFIAQGDVGPTGPVGADGPQGPPVSHVLAL